jgi:hypothetical protein
MSLILFCGCQKPQFLSFRSCQRQIRLGEPKGEICKSNICEKKQIPHPPRRIRNDTSKKFWSFSNKHYFVVMFSSANLAHILTSSSSSFNALRNALTAFLDSSFSNAQTAARRF